MIINVLYCEQFLKSIIGYIRLILGVFLDAIASLAIGHDCESVGVLLKLKQLKQLKLESI